MVNGFLALPVSFWLLQLIGSRRGPRRGELGAVLLKGCLMHRGMVVWLWGVGV